MSFIGAGIAEHDIGGFPLADSESVADPLLGLLSDPTDPREFLLRATPLSGGSPAAVDLSGNAYRSQSTDSPHKLFPGAIRRPYNFTASLPLPDMSGGVSLGTGVLELSNGDGLLDADAQYDWLGQSADVYLGPPEPASLTLFTRIFRGKAAGTVWTLDDVSILHRDLRYKLEKRLQPHRYMGTGPCLRFDASGDYVDYGDILDQGTNSFGLEVLFRSTTTGTVKVLIAKKADLTNAAGFALFYNASNNLIMRIADGSASISATLSAGSVYLDGNWHRASAVVNRGTQLIYLYVDGELVATSASIAAIGSVSSASTLQVGAVASGSSWSGDLDDFRFVSPPTQAEIQSRMHRELTDTEAVAAALYSKFNEGSGATAADSSGNGRNGTITGATWVSSLEGDASIAGTPKPVALGKRRQVAPKWVSTQLLILQLHDGAMQAIDEVRDSGDPLTFGADVADIQASTPGAGTYNTSLAKGYIRLGSSPVGQITADVRGDNAGSLGYTATAATIHRKLMTTYGGLTDPTDLDVAAYTALNALNDAVTGHYFDAEINVDAAADLAVKAINAWWGPTRVATATLGRIDDPADETPTVSWTQDDLDQEASTPYRREPLGVRVGEVVIGYRPYHTTLSPDQVAGAVSLSDREDFGKPYRFVSSVDPDRTEDADTITIYTDMDEAADAQDEAARILAFLSRDLGKITLALDSGALNYYIGTIGSLAVTQTRADGTTFARYDTGGGKHVVVVGIAEDMGEHGSPDRLEVTAVG